MRRIKIFLASSSELKDDRDGLEIAVNRVNKELFERHRFLHLERWEDFLDVMSRTRLQDEYNRAVRESDLFVMLFWTKVGPFTSEEFETAFKEYQSTNRPFILTYFKDASKKPGSEAEKPSLDQFQQHLKALGHFPTRYQSIEGLELHFRTQLDKLIANGFTEYSPGADASSSVHPDRFSIAIKEKNVGFSSAGSMNVSRSDGAFFAGAVTVTNGDIIGRDKIVSGLSASEMDAVVAPLRSVVDQAPSHARSQGGLSIDALRDELSKGEKADDQVLARIVERLADIIPNVAGAVENIFVESELRALAGELTMFSLDELPGQ